MKLLTFLHRGRPRLGALWDGHVLDLPAAFRAHDTTRADASPFPRDMQALLRLGGHGMAAARAALSWWQGLSLSERERLGLARPLETVRLLAPVSPPKMMFLALNYRTHAAEMAMQPPPDPYVFLKPPSVALAGPGETVRAPAGCTLFTYEAELAVVIGRPGRNIPLQRAYEHVAGYTACNDLTARDLQRASPGGPGLDWFRGKSFDGAAPLGPWLVTPDEIPDPHALEVTFRLNGRTLQRGRTSELIFGIPELVAFASRTLTLEVGDVISTGTPAGTNTPLNAGDKIEVEIERIGVLRNLVGEPVSP